MYLNISEYVTAARVEDGMSPPGLNTTHVLGKPLFCALIDFTAAIYKIQTPRKNAGVLK